MSGVTCRTPAGPSMAADQGARRSGLAHGARKQTDESQHATRLTLKSVCKISTTSLAPFNMQPNILLLGLGNLLLRDEGLGIRALEVVQEQYHLPPHVTCADGGVLGLELLAYVEGVTHLLVLDAVRSGQTPGTLVRLEGNEISQRLSLKLSMHQVSFHDILALSRLRRTVPPLLVVWGIEPAVLEAGVGLSELVEKRLDHLAREVVGELHKWGVTVSPKSTDQHALAIERRITGAKTLRQLSNSIFGVD